MYLTLFSQSSEHLSVNVFELIMQIILICTIKTQSCIVFLAGPLLSIWLCPPKKTHTYRKTRTIRQYTLLPYRVRVIGYCIIKYAFLPQSLSGTNTDCTLANTSFRTYWKLGQSCQIYQSSGWIRKIKSPSKKWNRKCMYACVCVQLPRNDSICISSLPVSLLVLDS